MRRPILVLSLFAFACAVVAQQTGELGKRPITTVKNKVGDLLRKWEADGTAAGNVGDWYDNRDGGHSDLNTAPYPQLQRVVYSEEDQKARRHWAAARIVRDEVTFGNSSTSAPPKEGGSNPRSYYSISAGLQLLHQQYVKNNIYIYPEHRDHDPGHNGPSEGFGDLYPTNTPYLFISQGSSGSDQPFMRAIPYVLAAFRPDVKKKLVETGLLMPTVQMLFRRHSKRLKGPEEYFTYKAHPTVFEGSWVDDLALVQAAHELTLETIPPMVQLKAIAEDSFQPGKDYFDPLSEKLGDTPCVIARIWRATAGTRRMTVSAEASFDVNKRPLTYKWVVLRGDADKIKIEPKNKESSVVELTVPYHERRPIFPGAELESNRVDIGVFVDNGANPSAPGFVTFCSLDSESRTYDDKGRIREIGYGAGEVVYTVTDWPKWIAAAQDPATAELLRLTDADRKQLADAAPKLEGLEASLKTARDEQKEAESRRQKAVEAAKKDPALETDHKKADAESQEAQKVTQAKLKARDEFLDGKGEPTSVRKIADKRLREAARADDFSKRLGESKAWAEATADVKKALEAARDPALDRTTEFGQTQTERQQALVLSRVLFPGSLSTEYRLNHVDRRLSAPKFWRDVYRYHADGELLGWIRHDGRTTTEYSVHGLLVEEKDARGRCTVGRIVDYRLSAGKTPNAGQVQPFATDSVVMIRYADDRDRVGKAEKKEERPR